MPEDKKRIGRLSIPACLLLASAASITAQGLHPGWSVVNLRPDNNFRPMVTGLGFLSDGRLVVGHWGGLHSNVHQRQMKGAVYIVKDVTGDTPSPSYTTFASELEDPAGMLVKDDRIYVTGGEKLIELPDANKDGKAEAARVIVQIPGTHARHEFLFGLAFKDGKFWMNPSSGKDVDNVLPAWGQKNPNRGTVMSVDPTTGAYEVFAMGLREPNGIGLGPENEIFVPDVQGNWLPANKIINVKKGRFYGFKHEPAETWDNMKESPPVAYLPQGELARAPSAPLYVPTGRYAGQLLYGDAVQGGIYRVSLDKVNNEYQGAVFFFSDGLEAGPERLLWGPDGHLYVGMCGQGSGWSYKQDWGLQKLKPSGRDAFEMLAVRSRQGGLEIEFTHEINAAAQDKASYTVRSWHYVSTSAYGGPATGTKTLAVNSVQVSSDKKKVFLAISGLETGKVVKITLATGIASSTGLANWTRDTWYTLNFQSNSAPFEPTVALAAPKAARPVWESGIRIQAQAGRLEVASLLADMGGVEIRDVRGNLVAEIPVRGGRSAGIGTAGWAPGVYSISVRAEGGEARRLAVVR
jgi:glucose/arabinose dehydrogenase